MSNAVYPGVVLAMMLAVGIALAVWPDRIQAAATRQATQGWPASAFKGYVESRAYPVICRVIGVVTIVFACFGFLVLVLTGGK